MTPAVFGLIKLPINSEIMSGFGDSDIQGAWSEQTEAGALAYCLHQSWLPVFAIADAILGLTADCFCLVIHFFALPPL